MMNIEINIMDYVSEDEIKNTILESIASYARQRSEAWYTRVLTNVAYREIFDEIDKELENTTSKEIIKSKIKEIISEDNMYGVFRDKHTFGYNSIGQEILEECIKENRDLINKRVVEKINNHSFRELEDEIGDVIYECIIRKFKEDE